MSTNYPSFPEDSARADQANYNKGLDQPPSITTAVMLMRVGAAISALGVIVTLVQLGAIKDQTEDNLKSAGGFTQSELDSAFQLIVVAAVVGGLIGIALWLWMASANGKGKKWARIVATVLGVINVLSFLYAASAGTTPTLSLLVGAASMLVGIAALVFMYRQDASAFYNANSGR